MDRREFLRKSIYASLGGVGLYSAFGNLKLVEAAIRASGSAAFSDYKALVCVFLYGGNDAMNMLIPTDSSHYSQYASARATLAVPHGNVLPLTPLSGGAPSDGGSYGLQASISGSDQVGMSGLQSLFDSGAAAVLANVGTLTDKVTKSAYTSGHAALPPQLFSHEDQLNYWQISRTDDPRNLGWGGRISDLLNSSANPDAQIPMAISLNAESALGRSAAGNQYVIGTYGPRSFGHFESNEDSRTAMLAMMSPGTQQHVLERSYASSFLRARENAMAVGMALDAAPTLATQFPGSDLAAQLRMVAKLISVREALGMQRQIFFVSMGGFDNHDRLLTDQPPLLAALAQALTAFYDATVELNIADSVTTFTASDFGRTLSSNGDGSDHGWGGHHFIVGGGVKGGRFYGTMPTLQNGGPDDAGWGQIIPTTSVDQYAATLARWFGVQDTDLDLILPNLGHFDSRNLGFMNT